MLDALYIYFQRYVITLCIWNDLVYTWKKKEVSCHMQKSRMSLWVIHRYYNIHLVSLIKNAKILKFTFCEVKHNYYEQKVRVLATLLYAWLMGIQSHHHGWLHCVQVHGDIQSHCHGWLLAYARGSLGQGSTRSFIECQSRSTFLQ